MAIAIYHIRCKTNDWIRSNMLLRYKTTQSSFSWMEKAIWRFWIPWLGACKYHTSSTFNQLRLYTVKLIELEQPQDYGAIDFIIQKAADQRISTWTRSCDASLLANFRRLHNARTCMIFLIRKLVLTFCTIGSISGKKVKKNELERENEVLAVHKRTWSNYSKQPKCWRNPLY